MALEQSKDLINTRGQDCVVKRLGPGLRQTWFGVQALSLNGSVSPIVNWEWQCLSHCCKNVYISLIVRHIFPHILTPLYRPYHPIRGSFSFLLAHNIILAVAVLDLMKYSKWAHAWYLAHSGCSTNGSCCYDFLWDPGQVLKYLWASVSSSAQWE